VNVSPAFPTGPYTALAVDSKHPGHLAVGTATGRVAWSEDAGRSSHESIAIASREFSKTTLRGLGGRGRDALPTIPQCPLRDDRRGRTTADPNCAAGTGSRRAAPTGRAGRLFGVASSKGLPWARWASWMVLNDSNTDISGIALPSVDGRMALATSAGVYLSDVKRSMWTRTLGGPGPMPNKDDLIATSIAISPTNPRIVVAGTSKGLYVSHDGGNTFSAHVELSDTIYGVVWNAARPELLLAITGDGVMQSSDDGKHFEGAFSGEVRDVTLTEDGGLISTSDGIHVISSAGDKTLLAGKSIIGAVPWQGGATLAATETALFVVGTNGGRIELLHTAEADPFLRLVGHEPFAYAMTSTAVYRIGQAEKRLPARKPPHLRLSLEELERLVMRNTIETPDDTRLHERWYSRLLPQVVVEVSGVIDRTDSVTYDATFPVSFRAAHSIPSARTEWIAYATWDLGSILFGSRSATNPNLVIESQLRATRDRIAKEVRTRYREAAELAHELARPPADPLTAFDWRMRLEELSAYLEALAGRQVLDPGTNDKEGE